GFAHAAFARGHSDEIFYAGDRLARRHCLGCGWCCHKVPRPRKFCKNKKPDENRALRFQEKTPTFENQGRGAQEKTHALTPWHFLYFLPEPQGQGSLRPTLAPERTGLGGSACAAPVWYCISFS